MKKPSIHRTFPSLKRGFWWIPVFVQTAFHLFAKQPVHFDHITIDDGLSQSTINCIYQDHRGFIWIGTDDGLNRYDGYEFTVYKYDPKDSNSLSDNLIQSIFEDASGVLWVGTSDGLNKYDGEYDSFVLYKNKPMDSHSINCNYIRVIYEDRSGLLWIGTETGGLNCFDRETEYFAHHRHAPDDSYSLSDNTVSCIYETRAGELWIGTSNGLNRLDVETGRFHRYFNDASDPHSLSHNGIHSICEDRLGNVWIGTDDGLNRFDSDNGLFHHYRNDPNDLNSLSHDAVRAVFEDRRGNMWVGTGGGGLNRYDREKKRFIRNQYNPLNPNSLSQNDVRCLYEDRSGLLWIGMNTGLDKLDLNRKKFRHYKSNPLNANGLNDNEIWAILEDRDGMLWVGTESGGVNRLDLRRNRATYYKKDSSNPHSISGNCVVAICEDRLGTLWFGTYSQGLNKFNRQEGTFVHYRHVPEDPNSIRDDGITMIYEDRSGTLWIGTDSGILEQFDRTRDAFIHYETTYQVSPGKITNAIWSILEDSNGRLWVGTDREGLKLFDRETATFTHYMASAEDNTYLSHNSVLCIFEDSKKRLWIGTGGGLNKYNPMDKTFAHYREADGLPNDMIYGILEDDDGELWLSTNRGLSRFDPESEYFKNFDVRDGLQSNEFNAGAYHKRLSGEMFFGGINGITAFFPKEIQSHSYVPPVVLTDFLVFNQSVRIGDQRYGCPHLTRSLQETDQIILTYRNQVFSFKFAALDFRLPEKNRYAYRLEGFEEDWNYVGNQRLATYTNLPPGDFVFKVKASNPDDVWNAEGCSIHIKVLPPFWQTWWFRALFVTFVLLSVFVVYKMQMHSMKRRNKELQRINLRLNSQIAQRKMAEKTIRQKLDMERTISAISSRFVGVTDIDDAIQSSLAYLGLYSKASRVYLYCLNKDKTAMEKTYEWLSQGVPPLKQDIHCMPLERFTWWMSQLNEKDLIKIEDITSLPPEAKFERDILKSQGIHSLLVHPMMAEKHVLGFVGFDRITENGKWRDEDFMLLSVFSGILAHVFERCRAEDYVRASLKEKEVLLKEIHHRVKNNLQVISSLLNLQTKYIKDQGVLNLFRESQDRIRSMALIHERLYQSEDLASINFTAYIRSLTNEIFRAYRIDPSRIKLTLDLKNVHLSVDTAVPCGLIINELVSNALKYAFSSSDKEEGHVWISLCKLEDGEIELIIKDNGVGIPDDVNFRGADSLGLHLVEILAEDQLDGHISVNCDEGTEFRILFKEVSRANE